MTHSNKPLISIITPCYNASSVITHTIESVLAQTYHNWEMLIVDDCSADDSAEIIKKYSEKDSRIKYFKTEKASGSPSLPRNIGIENARGKYIAFLDSDDLWLPEKLEKQEAYAEENGYNFLYSDYEKINDEGVRHNRIVRMPGKSSFWDVIESCTIPCLTVFLTKDIIGKTRFKSIPKEDFIFWLDILKKDVIAYNVGEILALYREQKSSRSSNKFEMIKSQWEILRNVEGVKPFLASYFLMKFIFLGFLKYIK